MYTAFVQKQQRGWDEKSRQQQECAAWQSCPIIKYWLKITNRFFKLPFRARTGYIEVGILITLLSFFIEFSVNLNSRRKKDAQHMLPRRRAAAHFPVLVWPCLENGQTQTRGGHISQKSAHKIESENAFKHIRSNMRPREPVRQLLFATEIIALASTRKIKFASEHATFVRVRCCLRIFGMFLSGRKIKKSMSLESDLFMLKMCGQWQNNNYFQTFEAHSINFPFMKHIFSVLLRIFLNVQNKEILFRPKVWLDQILLACVIVLCSL